VRCDLTYVPPTYVYLPSETPLLTPTIDDLATNTAATLSSAQTLTAVFPTVAPTSTIRVQATNNQELTETAIYFGNATYEAFGTQQAALSVEQTETTLAWIPTASISPSSTPSFTYTPSGTFTETSTTATQPTITFQTTESIGTSMDIPQVTVNVESANLRSGPGTNYSIVGAAFQGEQLEVAASTSDRAWYLVTHPNPGSVWIAASVTTLNVANVTLSIAATIPPTPQIIVENQEPATTNSGTTSSGIWSPGTIVRLGCSNCTFAQMYIDSACSGGQTIRIIDYRPSDRIYATVQNYAGCGIDGRHMMYEVVLQDHGTRGWILDDFVLGP
jgi:SH3-like domain-containing protein